VKQEIERLIWLLKARIILNLSWRIVKFYFGITIGCSNKMAEGKNLDLETCAKCIRENKKGFTESERRKIFRNLIIVMEYVNTDAAFLIIHYIKDPNGDRFKQWVDDLWEYYLFEGEDFFKSHLENRHIERDLEKGKAD